MWSDEVTLIKDAYTFDDIGNQISSHVKNTVFCDVKSISRSEFYNATTTGLKPSLVFIVHNCEYDNEEKVEYEGNVFKVIRTYIKNTEEIELTCEKVLGND